jgi:hypothetical protein
MHHRALTAATLLVATLLAVAPLLAGGAGAADAPVKAQLTDEERTELGSALQQALDQTLELVRSVSKDDWSRRPAADRWSVGEVVEHLVLAESFFRQNIRGLVDGEPADNWEQLLGQVTVAQLLAAAQDRSQKFSAPEPISPQGGMARKEALERLRNARKATLYYVKTTADPLKQVAAPGPTGAPLNGHLWLALAAGHNLRHNLQIAEVIDQLG